MDEVQRYEQGILTPGFAHTVPCDTEGTLVVPVGTKAIRGAFRGCSAIRRVVLPEGLIEIGGSAFNCCENLESVSFPDSLRLIGEYAFASCPKLREAILPVGLERVEPYAFSHCDELKIVRCFPDRASISKDAFYGCPKVRMPAMQC